MKKNIVLVLLLVLVIGPLRIKATNEPEFSTAGFYELPNSGRTAYSMNPAWRFYKGEVAGAESVGFNDQSWKAVSLPHGIEYLPTEASGCINYQGVVWYRKHFTPLKSMKDKKLFLYFEAIMGKSKIYVNGKLVSQHYGGYLPVVIDVTDVISFGKDNLIAVWADNSDDPSYPPGKAQNVLDFTYFGGIYRDCWLVAYNPVHITDPNYEDETAGGGLFVAYDKVSEASAEVLLKLQVRNEKALPFSGKVEYELVQSDGKRVATFGRKMEIPGAKAGYVEGRITVRKPQLWSPESPNLYNLIVSVYDKNGVLVDGYRQRIGIRSFEFKGKDGFWLNGKPYETPLIGANRHQDFAIIGNALPNSLHWRDAKKLRDAGLKVIRNAHCPQDPAFMDACDELGLLVIINTPGWQFWNEAPSFAQRVYRDIRNVVRRDRNHPCSWLWEPILNETSYPADFAKKTHDIVSQEYPYPSCYSACDAQARGHEFYSVQFTHPVADESGLNPNVTYFTREWGDNVDDWSSHNSPSRVARNWGEQPMLVQARHYANPYYKTSCYDWFYRVSRQYVGGCLWHSFDHQRGYHPDPFYGGLMDVFRQPKLSYYMFQAQRSPIKENRVFETGPMVYIAHFMTPFSDKDVTVYSNCDEVRLTYNKGGKTWTYTKRKDTKGMPSPIITFKDVYDFMIDKQYSRQNKQDSVYLFAEGLMNGQVVATHKVSPARRPSRILLSVDNEGMNLNADGSDLVTVIASIADDKGNIKRLNNDFVRFSIEGEGRLVGGSQQMANPVPVKWGTAPVLVQSTLNPGKIKITATLLYEGSQKAESAILELESKAVNRHLLYDVQEAKMIPNVSDDNSFSEKDSRQIAPKVDLKEVEKQQEEFGEKR